MTNLAKTTRLGKWGRVAVVACAIAIVLLVLTVIYGLYVSGGFVRFPDVFYGVGCSFFSFRSGYFTKVAITFDKSIFDYHGLKLSGFVEISVTTPYGLYTWSYWLSNSKTICIDLSKAINDFVRYYSELRRSGRYGKTDLTLPTIWITFYMYDKYGHFYIGTYTYDTSRFLRIVRKLQYYEAVRESIKDPLQLFRQPLWIVVTRDEIEYTNMTNIFNYAMNRLVKSIYHTSLKEEILHGRSMNFVKLLEETHMLKIEKTITITASSSPRPPWKKPWPCMPDMVKVFWDQLYNARNSPPRGWMSRIEYFSDDVKKELWKVYATYYSLAYFYSKKYYTADEAVKCVAYHLFSGSIGLGQESAFSMQCFLGLLKDIKYGPYLPAPLWNNIIKPGTEYHIEVPIGVSMVFITDAPVQAHLEIQKFKYSTYRAGIAFLGYLIDGVTNAIGNFIPEYGYADEKGPDLYIIVPTTLRYVADGISLAYYVTDTTINGTDYWVVIPVSTFPIPYYTLEDFDVSSAKISYKYPSQLFGELVNWTNDEYKLVFREVIPAGTQSSTILYNDFNVASWEESSWAGLVSNFLQSLLKILLPMVFTPEDELLALFYRIALGFFTFTYVNSKIVGIEMLFDVHTTDTVKHNFVLYVYKLNTKDQPIYIVKEHKYIPLMLQYYIIIQKPLKEPISR